MKFIWEESDIVPGTRLKHKHGEQYIIGYDHREKKVYMIISLLDGQVIFTHCNAPAIADFLNGFEAIPLLT